MERNERERESERERERIPVIDDVKDNELTKLNYCSIWSFWYQESNS